MLHEKNMPKIYWAEAVLTVVYLINRCTTEGVHDITPHEKYFGTKLDLSHMKVFGNIAFVHVPDEKRRKLDRVPSPVTHLSKMVINVLTP